MYSNREIRRLLKKEYRGITVVQSASMYPDEYLIITSNGDILVEVADLKTAVFNEMDFSIGHEVAKAVITALIDNKDVVTVGAYEKLANNLYVREM